jgi:hypothetical protein
VLPVTASRTAEVPDELEVGPRDADEFLLAVTLTTQQMLSTGRRLGERPLLHHLSPDELLEFWAG